MNGQIHIFVGKGQSGELQAKDQTQPEIEKKSVEGNDTQKQAINTALIQAGQQFISQGINMYGQLTGDMTTIRAIDTVANIAGDALIIAKGGVIGAIAVGTKYALQAGNSILQSYQQNISYM
jgi:hypothetical protein